MKWMNKKWMYVIWVFVMTLLIGGCQNKNPALNPQSSSESNKEQTISDFEFLPEGKESFEDNKVDDLHAVINLPIKKVVDERQPDAPLITYINVGEGGCIRFADYFLDNEADCWAGVNGITTEGYEFSKRLSIDPDHGDAGNRFIHLKTVSGKKGYAACYLKWNEEWVEKKESGIGKVDEYWLYELDEKFQIIHHVKAILDTDAPIQDIMVDCNGNFHLLYIIEANNDEKPVGDWNYVVVSPSGEKVYERKLEYMGNLYAYGKGNVAVGDEKTYDNGEGKKQRRFYWCDLEKKSLIELSVSKVETVQKKMQDYLLAVTPISDDQIAWCTSEGIYVYDRQIDKAKIVYKWSNHGIIVRHVEDFAVMTDGSFAVVYYDMDGANYMRLEPTGDKEEIETIIFAVSSSNKDDYMELATLFQKRYPSYCIDIHDDYDEMSLLTWLGAGKGPVLVDTELTGLEAMESIWQPMDGFLEQTGLAEEIYPETLELGKIGNATYGIVRNFRIETLLVANSDYSDWNYEGFLNVLESFNGAAFTYRYMESKLDWREKYFDVLKNSYDDTYYFNKNNEVDEMIFGTNKFERVLQLSEKARNCPPPEDGKALRNGKALCEPYELIGLWDVSRLHRKLEANNEVAIGYPTRNGARNLLIAQSQIAMRSTATEEEKKIAYTFLKFMLSEEAFSAVPGVGFSVRKDCIDRQLDIYEITVESMKESVNYDPDRVPDLHREDDKFFFENLIQHAKVRKPFPASLQRVFDEEFGMYLSGTIDGEMLDDHLKSRVWLYMVESK